MTEKTVRGAWGVGVCGALLLTVLQAGLATAQEPGSYGPLSFSSVSAGSSHTCGLTTSGTLYCWGSNLHGNLGNGAADGGYAVPFRGAAGLALASVSADGSHTCAVMAQGAAYCWGQNVHGQLGIGTADTLAHTSPTAVAGGIRFVSVTAGGQRTCGVTTTGPAYCWGSNAAGGLGDGTRKDSAVPAPVAGGLTFAAVSAGGEHTCGVTTNGAAYCWGSNDSGQLGNDTTDLSCPGVDHGCSKTPLLVLGGLTFRSLSTGTSHTCGVTAGGKAYCWGANTFGQLGDGSTDDRSRPVLVAGGLAFGSVSTGESHTCGVSSDGRIYCWGRNDRGELGSTSAHESCQGSGCSMVPVAVSGGLAFTTVSAGGKHTCGLTTAGVVYCWGANGSGQLGDGTRDQSMIPVPVFGQANARNLSPLPPGVAEALVKLQRAAPVAPAPMVDSLGVRKSLAGTGAIVGGVVGTIVGGAGFYHFGRCDSRSNCARPSVAFLGAALGGASGAIVGAAIGSVIRR